MSDYSPTILVTGASGFIGLQCVLQLLEQGYQVRGTIRNLSSESRLRQVLSRYVDVDRLTFVATDLTRDDGWPEAVTGCKYVLHVASPLPATLPNHKDDVIVPARDGTLRVMRAAADAGVDRVVLTSSVAAMFHGHSLRETKFDEKCWSDTNKEISMYAKSKTLAERAAWKFVERVDPDHGLQLVTILPGMVLGPILDGRHPPSTSTVMVRRLLSGSTPGSARVHYSVVDVRDVAWAHIQAMTHPKAAGLRFCCVSDDLWMADIARILYSKFANRGYKVPKRTLPDLLVRIFALFDQNARLLTGRLGKRVFLSNNRINEVLNWEPHSAEEMIVATAESLIEHGFVEHPS